MLRQHKTVEDAIALLLVGTLSGSAALGHAGQFSMAIKTAAGGCVCALLSYVVMRIGETINTGRPVSSTRRKTKKRKPRKT